MTVNNDHSRPRTGRRHPAYDDPIAAERVRNVAERFEGIWVEHGPQRAIIARVRLLRDMTAGRRGVPLPGQRLSAPSQIGKSATLERIRTELAADTAAQGLPANLFQCVHINLDKKITLKSVYQNILLKLDDPDWDVGTEKVLLVRLGDFFRRLGTELLFIDEIQWLKDEGGEERNVTHALMLLLDAGIIPVVFVGDETSKTFFSRNSSLSGRLGVPLELSPAVRQSKRRRTEFRKFCVDFDEALVRTNAVSRPVGLDDPIMLERVFEASSGCVGRVARILEHAVQQSAWRGAETIEAYDLANVVRNYAMPTWKLDRDPFGTA